jgi:DNA repair protein RadC
MEAVQSAVAEIEVVYVNRQAATDRPHIATSSDAHQYLLKGFNLNTISLKEEFVALYLNRANHVLGIYKVGVGGISGVVADPKLVIVVALKIAAVSVIIAHNHPSGSLRPSRQDEELTAKIQQGARFMDIKVLDHLIISPDLISYYSMADNGFL